MEPEGSLPHPQNPATCPYLEPDRPPSPSRRLLFLMCDMVQKVAKMQDTQEQAAMSCNSFKTQLGAWPYKHITINDLIRNMTCKVLR